MAANDDLNTAIEQCLKDIHAGHLLDGQIHRGLYTQLVNTLTDAFINEFSSSFDFDSPDNRIANYIRGNIFQFSAAKSLAESRAFAEQIIDASGAIKSFKAFRKDVATINDQFNNTWLQTEYNQVISTSQNATKWLDIERDAEVLPYLEYRTMNDERVREEHAMLEGKVARFDDPVWDTIYPPNEWGCRCHVLQSDNTDGSKQHATNPLTMDDAHAAFTKKNSQFKTNAGKSGTAFTAADATIKLTDASKINKWDAVTTYGLKTLEAISASRNLPVRERTADSLSLLKAWNQNIKDAGIGGDRFLVANKVTNDRVVFSHLIFDKMSSSLKFGTHDVGGNLIDVIRNADEVFINAKARYAAKTNVHCFIKYYNDKPVAVLARMNEKENYLEAFDAFAIDGYKSSKQIQSLRRGILLHTNK